MPQDKIDLSVVIPTYNEMTRADLMRLHLSSIQEYFEKKSLTYELIVVLDGSTDNTPSIVKEFQKKNKHIQVVNGKINKGKGFSLREGMIKAQGNIVLFTDMDGFTPIYIDEFKKGCDIVIGSRKINPEKFIKTHQPKWKERIGEIGNVFIQNLLGLKGIDDTQCGFKAFTQKATKKIITRTTINRWGIDFEMLLVGKKLGYSIVEIPVEWNDSGTSLVNFKGYVNTFFDLISVKWKMLTGVYNK